MAYPIVKYRLRADGRQPEYLAGISTGFRGECATNTNVAGKIPKWLSPQENVMLGLAVGPADPAGLPSGCEGTIDSKSDLTNYITSISGSWTVDTEVTVGVSTYKEVGLTTCFDSEGNPSAAGITTTVIGTTTTSAGAGTTVGVNTFTSYSDSVTITDGVSTTTRTHTTTTQNTMQNPYDAAANATRLWDIYEAVNGL